MVDNSLLMRTKHINNLLRLDPFHRINLQHFPKYANQRSRVSPVKLAQPLNNFPFVNFPIAVQLSAIFQAADLEHCGPDAENLFIVELFVVGEG